MVRSVKSKCLAAFGGATLLLSSGCAMVAGEPAQEVVVIGADLELSGDDADLGRLYLDALTLRVEQVNEQGLLRGNRRLRLEAVDNRSDPATAASNLENLAADPAITAIISGACAECLLAATAPTEEGEPSSWAVPTISLAAAGAVVTPAADHPYVFKVGPNAADNAALIAADISAGPAETIAVVSTPGVYGESAADLMEDAARNSNLTVVVNEQITGEEQRLSEVAAQIAGYRPDGPPVIGQPEPEPGPDAVVVWAFAPLAGQFAGALRDAGYTGPLYLDSTAADELFLTGATARALADARLVFTETLIIDDLIATSPAKAARKTWFRDYSARYGTYHAFSSFAADAIELVVAVINRLDTTDRVALRDGFERIQLDGLSGPLRITPDNHSGLTSLALTFLVARGDRWQSAD